MIYLSYSKIKRFLICPFVYKWVDIDKKEFKHNKRYEEKRLISLMMGKYLWHLKMNQIHSRDLDFLKQEFDELWDTIYNKILPRKDYLKVRRTLLKYCDFGISHQYIASIGCDKKFFLSELQTYINVRFSQLNNFDNKRIQFVDYTTGKENQIIRNPENDLWLQIYAYALYDIFKSFDEFEIKRINITTATEHNLEMGDKNKIKQQLIEKVQLILQEQEFRPRQNQFCESCYIKSINKCEAHNG